MMNTLLRVLTTLLFVLFSSFIWADNVKPPALSGQNVVIVYKNNDALSKNIANYYAKKRNVPKKHIVGVDLGEQQHISEQKFKAIKKQVDRVINQNIKVLVLAWNAPYGVECMSITSAFTLGFDRKYCNTSSQNSEHTSDNEVEQTFKCMKTAESPYYNKPSSMLWANQNMQLTMMLSARTLREVKALIDRGVKSDYSQPKGSAYLVRTNDSSRSARWPAFQAAAQLWPTLKDINIKYIDYSQAESSENIKDKHDVMFYFTGREHVGGIESNAYLPGAIADHLTSAGGQGLSQAGQMKVYRWLEAGATGSYGGVVEPCNYPQKFPNVMVLLPNYLNGDTLIEAYWKSVQQPGEGIFVGEPLAAPWAKK